jgi:hypothetical protein
VNPLLEDHERELREGWHAQAQALLGPAIDAAESTNGCPAGVVEEFLGGVVGVEDVDARLALALAVEQAARVHGGIGAAIGNAGAAAVLAAEVCPDRLGSGLVSLSEAAEPGADSSRPTPGVMAAAEHLVVVGDELRHCVGAECAPIEFDGLRGCGAGTVPIASSAEVVGGADAAAAGRRILRLQQAALAVGLCAAAQDEGLAAVARRGAAGERADRSQTVQWSLADIATEGEAARVALWQAACSRGDLEDAAMALVLASEAAVAAARRARQIGGVTGAGSAAARLHRDAEMTEILGAGNPELLASVADALLPDIPRG